MRKTLDRSLLEDALWELGHLAKGPGSVYLTGGACALMFGWRASTVDVNLRLDPEPQGVFEGTRTLKQRMHINIELASPSDFIPELPHWRTRSVFIATFSHVSFYHYDLYAQALAKLERGHDRDLYDVRMMQRDDLIQIEQLVDLFEQIAPRLIRYPSLDEGEFRHKVMDFVHHG